MDPIGFSSLAVLFAAFVFQLLSFRTGRFQRVHKFLFWGSAVFVFLYYLFLVGGQYFAWVNGGGVTKFLVPPHNSIFYVFGYHFARFLLHYLVAFLFAVLFIVFSGHFNKKFGGRFLEDEEPYWGGLSILLLGNPAWGYAWIYYFIGLLVVSVVLSFFLIHVLRRGERFPLYWLWLPVAILVMLARIIV